MPIFLRQSTASQELLAFPFIDQTDGFTEEAGLTINNTDIKLAKTGVLTLASKNSGGATYVSNSAYSMTLDATDTNTIGPMQIFIHVAGARPVRIECCVLDEAVYDVLFGTVALCTWDETDGIETGVTPRQALRAIGAATAGIVSGAGTTTEVIKSMGGTTTRISATVDGTGNRTAVTLSLT